MSHEFDGTKTGRMKYDYISGKTCDVDADAAAIEAFMAENSGDPTKVAILRTAKEGGKNLRRREHRKITLKEDGTPDIRISVFNDLQRLSMPLPNRKTQAELDREAAQEERMRLRRERRAARIAAQNDSTNND